MDVSFDATVKDTTTNKDLKRNYLNYGENDQMEIFGYKKSKPKTFLTYISYILTFGLLRLFHHWYPKIRLLSTHAPCDLQKADKVLVIDVYNGAYKTYYVKTVLRLKAYDLWKNRCDLDVSARYEIFFYCKKLCYTWNFTLGRFVKVNGLDVGVAKKYLHSIQGLSQEEQKQRRITYGTNEITVPLDGIWRLITVEALTPFYVFQIFSVIVWLCEVYYYYAVAIVIMSVFGIASSVIQTRKNQKNLHSTVHAKDTIRVHRKNGSFEEVTTADLVPGDLIEVPLQGCIMLCDAVIIKGSCVVNESMLTGESVPVMKTSLPQNDEFYDTKVDSNHTLFCGTKVIQTKTNGSTKVLAVVIRTGFLTTKGQLVRSILYPPPADFKFDKDSYKFIGILAFIGLLSFIYTIVSKSVRGLTPLDILIKGLDVITIAIPPALPAAMTVGKLYALIRLKNKKVFCINSRVINVSGSINCVCFDKTGTLTEDGMDLWGVIPIEDNSIREDTKDVKTFEMTSILLKAMASCHSLIFIDGKLVGDPLDIKMFEATGWCLEENFIRPNLDLVESTIEIVHRYQFSSDLQRMSVIVKDVGGCWLFCKGSPEAVMALCGYVPEKINEKLEEFTEKGYRVIAIAYKSVEGLEEKEDRCKVERDLILIGILVMENKLKAVSAGVIKELKEACVKTVMITGDNIQTALSVAKESNFLDTSETIILLKAATNLKDITSKVLQTNHSRNNYFDPELGYNSYKYVLDGTTWSALKKTNPMLIPEVIKKGVVFARMSGAMKQEVVQELQHLGYYVAMCGDGANDCSALKAAHVGISLSEAESSVASPFTYKESNISCVPLIIREGRAALTTSFGVFKFMLCYSLTELASVLILYSIDSNLTSIQYLFIDVCLVLVFASLFGNTKAYKGKLHKKPPIDSLLSFVPLVSLSLHMAIVIVFQLGIFFLVQTYSWFVPFQYDQNDPLNYSSYENYSVFSLSMFQYISTAVVFSKGKPYRQPIYTNLYLCLSILVMTIVCMYLTLFPAKWILDVFEILLPPEFDVRYALLGLAVANFVTALLVEELVEFGLNEILKRRRSDEQTTGNNGFGIWNDSFVDEETFSKSNIITSNEKN